MTEKTKKEEEKTELPNLVSLLKNLGDAPDESTIEQWKVAHGEVLCSGLSETELFLWRPLTRGEFSQLQMAAAQQEPGTDQEFIVVQQCLLWASELGTKALHSKAGTITTIHEQIMQNSNFVDPRMASMLVVKL